jgi:hypothetical protein
MNDRDGTSLRLARPGPTGYGADRCRADVTPEPEHDAGSTTPPDGPLDVEPRPMLAKPQPVVYHPPPMSDRRTRRTPPPRFNAVIASATIMSGRPPALRRTRNEAWWDDAWAHYDTNGELRFAVNWIASGLSQLNLIAARRPELLGDDPAPLGPASDTGTLEADAIRLVGDIAGGPDGQSQLLARLATLLTVPGLGWVLIESDPTSHDGWQWRALSNEELRSDRGVYEIEDAEYDESVDGWREIATNHVLIKVWRSHPRRASQPDSSTRGALRPLRQLALLDDHIEATATSRLAGAGLLIMPNEVEFAPVATLVDPDDPDAQPDGATTDDFVEVMIDTFTPPIVDRGLSSAVVPLTVKMPGEYVDKVRHLTFWSEFSDTVLALGERAIKRLALALDMPPEIITGVSGMNHWGAWRVQEEAITLHIEPLALVICHALTKGYLRPTLLAMGHDPDEVDQLLISVDSTNLTVRPDLSDDTLAAYDRMEASSATLRREIGLSESDKPSAEEVRERIIMRAIDRSPQLASALLPMLGIPIDAIENEQQYPTLPTETTPGRQIGGPPNVTASASGTASGTDSRLSEPALLAACDGLVYRALERAGARLRNKAGRVDGGAAGVECGDVTELHTQLDASTFASVHELLDGAWNRVPIVAAYHGVPAEELLTAVDSYTRGLLVNGQSHTIQRLAAALPLSAALTGG